MRFQSYFNTALILINGYNGSMPLANYLKQYFAQHKKHGGRDRRYISHLCYCYYRLGHALMGVSVEERLKAALFISIDDIAEWNILFSELWMKNHSGLLRKRVAFIQNLHPFSLADIFPWQDALSDGIDMEAFALSHLVQPDLFLRIRPGKQDVVLQKLKENDIEYKQLDNTAVALPNATKIDTVVAVNKEVIVQDYSSQQVQQLFSFIKPNGREAITTWDCCAASGGKSILAYDNIKNIELTVSDIRASIIHNLQQRFFEAGIKDYRSFVADVSDAAGLSDVIANRQYNLVICDAPCTGSGTWGRTPEQLYFFTEDKIAHYSTLQQKIVLNVIPHVKKDGYLLYITCSVFKQENEAVTGIIQRQGLTLVEQRVIAGYNKNADTMYAVLFKK